MKKEVKKKIKKKPNIKITATISKYRMKFLGSAFFGVMVMVIITGIISYIKPTYVNIMIILVGWLFCIHLIEKEVNHWLNKDAELNLIGVPYLKCKKKL